MTDPSSSEGLRGRLTRQGEDALGKLTQELLENPLLNAAITRAFEAGQKASQAQEVALGALNIPSAADIERLTRRVRSVSQRLEGIEDGVDRLDESMRSLSGGRTLSDALERIERQLASLAGDVEALKSGLPQPPEPVARGQERLSVGEPGGR